MTSTSVVPSVELEEQFAHRLGGGVVEVAGGLVGQQQARAVHQCAGDGHSLLLATRQLRRPVVQAVAQAHPPQHRGSRVVRPAHTGHLQRQRGVVERAQAGQQVEALEDDADAVAPQVGQAVGVERGEVDAVDADAAGGRPLEPRQQQQQRGLARARRPGDGHARAGGDAQVHAAQHGHGARADGVVHAQAIGVDQRRR